jgi:hypothetical protein
MARTPFYGRGPAPQIARMDMQAATAPGRNWGKAFESIGQTVGQAVEKHREHKKAKEKERDFIDSFEARISKSPDFARSLGLNPDDLVEVRLAGKTYFNSPETRQLSQDFSRFQEKDRARAGATEYLDLMLPSQAETVEPSDSGIRDFFSQGRANADAAGLASVQSPSAFTARLEGMPIESPEAKQMLLGRQLELQKAETAGELVERELAIKEAGRIPTPKERLDVEKLRRELAEGTGSQVEAMMTQKETYDKVDGFLKAIEAGADVTGPIEGQPFVRWMSDVAGDDDVPMQRDLEILTNALVLEGAQKMKGNLSDKDIRFLQATVPQMTDKPGIWKKWLTDFKQRLVSHAAVKGGDLTGTQADSAEASSDSITELERLRKLRAERGPTQ